VRYRLRRTDGALLATLTFSFAYVMLSSCVPDHFILSLFMLILTLYVAGRKLVAGDDHPEQTVALPRAHAGISPTTSIKVFWPTSSSTGAVLAPGTCCWLVLPRR
jgi:hypothetical protein